ncbi:hypothetical protein ACF0H5_011288 [Mactra antiquata]
MAYSLTNSQRISLKINRIFDYLSVNEETIRHRRNVYLQIECIATAFKFDQNIPEDAFYFGSQSEGTTTIGLNSDYDGVMIPKWIHVITRAKDSILKDNIYAFKMEEFTEQGYCLLRDLSFVDNRNPRRTRFKQFHKSDTSYLKNTYRMMNEWHGEIPEKDGPAILHQTKCGRSINFLHGFACTSWPQNVTNTFVMNQSKRMWPSDHLLQDILQSKCFVVPKGSDTGSNSDIEWRLSFSCGERLLMFDLNIVHIRCYILMKYIKTEFLDCVPNCKGIVSSYICKTVLFHVLSRSLDSHWLEEELLIHLNRCLTTLCKFIEDGNCPHFIMPKNNLLANKLDEKKKTDLLAEIQLIIASDGQALFEINIDEFGLLLAKDEDDIKYDYAISTQSILLRGIIGYCGWGMLQYLTSLTSASIGNVSTCSVLNASCVHLKKEVKNMCQLYPSDPNSNQRMADSVKIWLCWYSTLLGSYLASSDIRTNVCLSHDSFQWLLLGMQCTSVASAHLKLASILLESGELDCTDILVSDVLKKFNIGHVVHCCQCKRFTWITFRFEDTEDIFRKQTFGEIYRENIAYCVVFVPEEIHSCPKELRYEMYRGAFNEKPQGHYLHTSWVYLASVPQLSFLYFMQYKLYKKMENETKSNEAIEDLQNVEIYGKVCVPHLDTVYNLIGQCLEQEGYLDRAAVAYCRSLQIEPEYNAAKIHICCNIFKQFQLLKKNGQDS